MKRIAIALCAALLVVIAAGCANKNNAATPKPAATIKATATPAITTAQPAESASPAASPATTSAVEGGTIEGFVEGDSVEVDKLPEKVKTAVKEKYPDATIKAASYATYMQSQMYLITLDNADVERVYADAEGKLTDYSAETTGGE